MLLLIIGQFEAVVRFSFRTERDMKLAACFLLAVEAKIKLKSLEIPDEGFFTMEQSSEKVQNS